MSYDAASRMGKGVQNFAVKVVKKAIKIGYNIANKFDTEKGTESIENADSQVEQMVKQRINVDNVATGKSYEPAEVDLPKPDDGGNNG